MTNAVEEGPDIEIEHPVLVPTTLASHGQRVMGASPRPVSVAVGMEDRLKLLFQQHRCRGLSHPVCHIRHTENPDPGPVILRYLNRSHRPREVAPRGHPIPQLVEVVHLVGREIVDAHSVHARRSAVRSDLLPRLENETLRNFKRLQLLLLRSICRFLPRGVDLQTTLNCPAPSLRPHYRALTATTGRSAPVPRIGTLALAVSAACGSPSRGQQPGRLYRGDRFSCSMPAPATSSRHLYTEHRRGHIQPTPRLRAHRSEPLSRDHPQIPVSMPSLFGFDASAVVHTCSSSHRTPAPLTARRQPQRSPPRLLTDAACGGLESPPARRPRRTHPHHWHSTDRADDLLHHHHFPSGHTWVPIIRSWALTRGFALHPGTRNRYEIRYTRTQHRPRGSVPQFGGLSG